MLLVIAYTLIALTLVVVVVDITAVYLQRDQLFSVADSTALDAANALDQASFYQAGPKPEGTGSGATTPTSLGPAVVPVSDQTVRQRARAFLRAEAATTSLRELGLAEPTGTDDGRTAEITVVSRAHLPLLSFVVARWARGVPLRATVRARTTVQPG